MPHPAVNQRPINFAPRRPCAIPIHLALAAAEVPRRNVQQHTGGPGVEGRDPRPSTASPVDRSNVANTTEVIHTHVPATLRKYESMKHGGQGRSLATGRKIRRT